MKKTVDSVLELIGNTPLVRIRRLPSPDSAELWGKLESLNPGGSVKDRIALSMVQDAEDKGILKPGDTIVESTSGNTGIGVAMIAAAKGYKAILIMPENISLEHRLLLLAYGAEVILTPANEGMSGSVEKAQLLLNDNPGYFMPMQFDNPANPEAHRRTTAKEIWEATQGKLDAFVAGVGTGGTITGVAEVLKKKLPNLLVVGVEPERSPLLSAGRWGVHGILGIGANFIPKVLNSSILDEIITVSDEDAFAISSRLALEEGLLVGVSAGANVFASLAVAKRLGKGKKVVTILPDSGERYLSLELESHTSGAARSAAARKG